MFPTLLLILACAHRSAPVPAAVPPPIEVATDSLGDEWWDAVMETYPTWASTLGLEGYSDRISAIDPAAQAAWVARQEALLARVRAVPSPDLDTQLLEADIQASLASGSCEFWRWQISPRGNPLVNANSIAETTQLETMRDAEDWLTRIEALTAQLPTDADNRASGAARGRAVTRSTLDLVIAQVHRQLEQPRAEWPLMSPFSKAPETLSADAALQQRARDAIDRYATALSAWADRIEAEVGPVARSTDVAPGLSGIPGGASCYAAMIRHHVSLPLDPDDIHQTGLDEIARIHGEVAMLGKKVLDTSDVQEIFTHLRSDPSLYFETEDQVEGKAVEALARASDAMPDFFGILPETPCEVARIPDYLAPYTTIAYYQPLALGQRPGTYYVNTYAPETRPRHEAEVLAFHESIPGHHLQIAISQERGELPMFRRHMQTTAFVEGWGLYSERLSDEMGLYSGDMDRFGMYSFDLWRAARLVVDTGIHHKGWSRQQAIDFMLENTPLAENNIVNEVDRYINTPGQALAYKLGQLEILALRAEAEAALGEDFSLPQFHDVVLSSGAVTLPVLRTNVETWIEGQRTD